MFLYYCQCTGKENLVNSDGFLTENWLLKHIIPHFPLEIKGYSVMTGSEQFSM